MLLSDDDDVNTYGQHLTHQSVNAEPAIDNLNDIDNLFNEGIIHNGYYYGIQTFPRLCSTAPITLKGFYSDSTNSPLPVRYQYFYDKFDRKNNQNRMQAPRDNYLNLIWNEGAEFKSTMLENVFAVEVTPETNSSLHKHYLIPRKTKLLEGRANAQQIEIAIREGKAKLPVLRDRFDLLIKDFTGQQQAFVYKCLNIVEDARDNFDLSPGVVNPHLNSHVVVPFKDYLSSLKSDEKVKVLVGRGQLASHHEFYNQPISSSIILPPSYNPYTIDIDPTQIPHLVADITNINHFSEIPDESVDEFYFDGVTYSEVYKPTSGLYEVLARKLKVGGQFITNWGSLNAQKLYEKGFGQIETLKPQEDYFNFLEVKSATKIR